MAQAFLPARADAAAPPLAPCFTALACGAAPAGPPPAFLSVGPAGPIIPDED